MTNHFDCGAIKIPEGWIAYYRMVHWSENFVLRQGKRNIIFPTKQAAKDAAHDAFMSYLNSPISGMTAPQTANWDSANAAFNLPATERPRHVRGKSSRRLTEVVRRAKA